MSDPVDALRSCANFHPEYADAIGAVLAERDELQERLGHAESDGYGRAANEEAGRLEAEAKLAEARSEIQRLGQDVFKSQQRRARAAQLRKRMLRQHVGYLNQIREAESREEGLREALGRTARALRRSTTHIHLLPCEVCSAIAVADAALAQKEAR
jgi:hypothetical protein